METVLRESEQLGASLSLRKRESVLDTTPAICPAPRLLTTYLLALTARAVARRFAQSQVVFAAPGRDGAHAQGLRRVVAGSQLALQPA